MVRCTLLAVLGTGLNASILLAQPLGEPDRGSPGDEMIQAYLARATAEISGTSRDIADWREHRAQYKQQYLYMLGLSPLPAQTPLQATVTGVFRGEGFIVEKLHYQSRPRLYATANLYRPPEVPTGKRLPAVLYVCGHSGRGRNGNKTAFQAHGIWFARHGYVCLVVDTLQLGEIAALHHGTYREDRWWWHSRGYTPAGVECWNGVRGIDYLASRQDVDSERIGVTGISGGGAATFWIAAADERVRVAVPISGMADLPSYVPNRVINGHCDCMFLYNTHRWPWTRIASLVAPRPMLFINSDQDPIFPMDANERVSNHLERLYSLYGGGDSVDSLVSIGGHAYREDIRKAAYRFINMHLKNDPATVRDSEVDLVTGPRNDRQHAIPPEQLRVFPTDSDIPRDQWNTTIDERFVPLAKVDLPGPGEFDRWRKGLKDRLRTESFGYFPNEIPAARWVEGEGRPSGGIETERGIHIPLAKLQTAEDSAQRVVLWVVDTSDTAQPPDWLKQQLGNRDILYRVEPRGIGGTRWTDRNPPNYVARSHVLLGRTVDAGRVWDVVAATRLLMQQENAPVVVAGSENAAIHAAYAALWEPRIDAIVMHRPHTSHMDGRAAQLLNVLRICDIPHVVGMLAPRSVTIIGAAPKFTAQVQRIAAAAGAKSRVRAIEPE